MLPCSSQAGPSIFYGQVCHYAKDGSTTKDFKLAKADSRTPLAQRGGGNGRHGCRDAALILLAYRHGLRVSELVALRWEQVCFSSGTIHINRLKQGVSATHPLRGPELRALRQLQRNYPGSPYLFVSERGAAMAAATARNIIERAGALVTLPGTSSHAPSCLRFLPSF